MLKGFEANRYKTRVLLNFYFGKSFLRELKDFNKISDI